MKSVFDYFTAAQISDVQTGSPTLDVSGAINTGINAQAALTPPGALEFPPGVYGIGGTVTIKTGVHLWGAGNGSTIMRVLPSHASVVMFQTNGFSTNTGTGNAVGPYKWGLHNMSFDGNRANVTGAANVMNIYGYDYILDSVNVYNGPAVGIYSEWSASALVPVAAGGDGMESIIQNCKTFGHHGIGLQYKGPHDSHISNLRAFECDVENVFLDGNGTTYDATGTFLICLHSYAANSVGGLRINTDIIAEGVESESNTGYGILVDSSGNFTGVNITTFGNTGYGLSIVGEWSHLNNINTYNNGSDGINVQGIYNNLSTIRSYSNTGYGLNVGGNNNLFQLGRLHSNTNFTFNGGTGNQLLNLFS